jgi:hypothetical protein
LRAGFLLPRYVTRILALMRGAGAIVVAPVLEVRLVD